MYMYVYIYIYIYTTQYIHYYIICIYIYIERERERDIPFTLGSRAADGQPPSRPCRCREGGPRPAPRSARSEPLGASYRALHAGLA